jgi:hypothetical protein
VIYITARFEHRLRSKEIGMSSFRVFLLVLSAAFLIASCGTDTASVAASNPVNGYVTPAGINAVPSQ